MSALKRTTFKELPPAERRGWNLRGLSVLSFAHGASDFFSGMVPLLIFTVVASQGLSPVYQGVTGFLWYLTSSIVQPLFGAYSDARGRWWFLPAAVLLTVVAVACAGLATSIWTLGTLVVAGGIGSAVMHPEAGKYSAMLSGSRKSGGISIFQIGGALGYAAGPLAIAALLQRFGPHGSLPMAAPGLLATAVLFALMPRVHRAAHRDHRVHAVAGSATHAVDHTGVILLVASTGLKYLTGAAFMTYLPNLVVAHGGSVIGAGELVSAFLGVGVFGLWAGGYLGDRFGPVAVCIASLTAAVPCLFGFFLLPAPLSYASLLLAGAMLNVQSAPGVAIVQRMLPRNLGVALGLMNGVAFGIGSALVAVVGIVVARAGAETALREVSFVPLLCAAAYVAVRRSHRTS